MRRLILVALLLLPATLKAEEGLRTLPSVPGERYADGTGYAGEALDRLLSRDLGEEAPSETDPAGPRDC